MPFWQTAVGGTAIIDGVTVTGAQNIFFAELASKSTTVFSVSATRFMAGKFPFMMFGLPGAALAMYQCAKPEKKKVAGGLLLSAALTAFLTGITEPLEFTFIFVALPMYAVHCVLAGLSFMLMHILNVGVGMTFSGGLIDLVLFGVMQGNAKTHWMWVVVVGAVYFVLYYIIFRFMISKFDYKTPGRDDAEEVKLYTRADVNARSAASGSTAPAGDDPVSALIVDGLGGANNLSDVDCCATRLRCTVKDAALVRQDVLKASGASGVICKGNGVQVVYGPKVAVIKAKLEDYLENAPKTPAATTTPAPAAPAAKDTVLSACLNGTVVPLADVKDPGDCDGQSGYGVSKLDSIVEEVVRQIFAQFREVSRKKLLESVKTNDAARIQKKVKKIQKDLENKQKELDDLKAETILVIRGVSALDKELLGTLVAEAREALETLEKQLVQAQEEYEEATKTAKRSNYICNELFTWADVYDTANHDERRAILQQFIKEIRVRKDYEISITLNASFDQVEQLKAVSTYDGAEIFEGISERGA